MSNLLSNVEMECATGQPCSAIELLIEPQVTDLGGFSVRRALPNGQRRMVGPWVFFDQMGPADFQAGQGIDVRPHPHVNLATVTYLFEGEIMHRDSLGSQQAIRPGDINLMVAGRGIVHSEREREAVRTVPHRQHGLQLWLALPEVDEEIEPAFYHYPSGEIPALTVDGVEVRVLIGSAFGVTSPVKTFADTLYVEAHLQAGQSIALPDAEERAVYVVQGDIAAAGTAIPEHAMAVFVARKGIVLEAVTATRLAIIGGARLGERHIYWNFVSSRKARIEQACRDWQNGCFPKVPGDDEEFIPLP
jgi:redox-sensitive bicupin YhaK (pirin superfamily)